jgi:outer membrane protein OmpA-like peptidoglycan-associated protein/opacity protein-like surface antigen
MKRINIFLVALMCMSTALFAQNKSATPSSGSDLYKGWSLYGNLGATMPYTDLNQYQFLHPIKYKNEYRFSGAIGVRKMFSSVVGLQTDFAAGSILGNTRPLASGVPGKTEHDLYTSQIAMVLFGKPTLNQAIYFKTNFWQLSSSVYFDLNNLGSTLFNARKGNLAKRKIAVYSYVGIGLMKFNTTIRLTKNDSAFTKYLMGVSGKSLESVIPVGLGVKYKLNNKINIGAEYRLNNVLSDKLDAFATNQTGLWLRQGNNDKYGYASVALTYNFVGSNPLAENIEWCNPLTDKADQKVPTAAEMLVDTDGDGVADLLDKEPNTPSNCRVDGSGRALDTDGDGVVDCKDRERLSPAGYPVDQNGVAQIPDTDGDGVADNTDWEVNSPAGCKVDTHGVCPKEENAHWGGEFNLPTVYFENDKSIIKKEYMTDLQRCAMTLHANPTMKVDIIGNTDKNHSDEYNEKLGMRRAKAVADILIMRFSVPAERINVKSNGKHMLKSPNNELNRRVDIIPAQ